jgi:hypothetical protein
MKIKFVTSKSNSNAVRNELAPFVRKAEYDLVIRDHKKNDNLIVVEMENRYSDLQDNFKGYLLKREREGMLRSLKIEQ